MTRHEDDGQIEYCILRYTLGPFGALNCVMVQDCRSYDIIPSIMTHM